MGTSKDTGDAPSLPAVQEETEMLSRMPPPIPPNFDAPDNLGMPFLEQERPPYIAGTIDVAAFVKSQSEFVRQQSFFLRSGRLNGGEEYVHNLTVYSKAQDDYIKAMHDMLQQLGVM